MKNAIGRRKSALSRLETQLEVGTKTGKRGTGTIALNPKDKTRIEKEITILKEKTK
jgi:hypothetical protein